MKNDEAQFLADKINSGGYGEPKREWVGLTIEEINTLSNLEGANRQRTATEMAFAVQAKLKDKNI